MATADLQKDLFVILPSTFQEFRKAIPYSVTEALKSSNHPGWTEMTEQFREIAKYSGQALQHGRRTDEVMIVLAGETGVGKSETINRLFNKYISATNDSTSETREVKYFGKVHSVKTNSAIVCGKLSFVDLPGNLDTDESKEAPNLASVKRFRQLLPFNSDVEPIKGFHIRSKVYPNLVLMTVNASDTRICGSDARFRKCLKVLKECDLVDESHNNVIIVATHAMSLGLMREAYETNCARVKISIRKTVASVFNIKRLKIVFVENKPEEFVYKNDTCDFYELPDGTLSHHNLMKAMNKHFERKHDLLGRLLCGHFFQDDPMIKHSLRTLKTIEHSDLSPEELQQATQLLESLNMQSANKDTVPKYQFHIIGHGYCPKNESFKTANICDGDSDIKEEEILGKKYTIPKYINICERPVNEYHRVTYVDREEYECNRMASYGLDVGLNLAVNVGANGRWINDKTRSTQNSMFSFLYETRLLHVRMGNAQSHLKTDLINAIENLPTSYNMENAHTFREFFSKWGSHYVCEVWIGGSIKVESMLKAASYAKEHSIALHNKFTTYFTAYSSLSTSANAHLALYDELMQDIQQELLTISGGKPATLTSLKELTPDIFCDWVTSVKTRPNELEYSIKLDPYYHLATGLRVTSLQQATLAFMKESKKRKLETRNEMGSHIVKKVSNEVSCFPANSRVYTKEGSVLISKLKPGDMVLTAIIGNSRLTFTTVYCYLHYDPDMTVKFLTFHLENGHTLTVTEDHLIFYYLNGIRAIRAKHVKIGDKLLFASENLSNTVVPVAVLNKSSAVITGVYSPLTKEGTLMVDGIFVSCYAVIASHTVAHASMVTLRLWYETQTLMYSCISKVLWLFHSFSGSQKRLKQHKPNQYQRNVGIHKYALFLRSLLGWIPVEL